MNCNKIIIDSSNLEETRQQLKQLGFVVVPETTFDNLLEVVREAKQLTTEVVSSNFKEGVGQHG